MDVEPSPMRIASLLTLLLLVIAVAPLPVGADAAGGRLTVVRPGVVTGDLGVHDSPEEALASVADALGVDAAAFAFTQVRESLVGTHHRGVQQVDGIPVAGTHASVHVVDGQVAKVAAVGSDAVGAPTPAPISQDAAEAAALGVLGVTEAIALSSERLLVPTDGRLVDTWRVSLVARSVAGTVDISAAEGTVIAFLDDRRFADATATLFDPNPIQSSGDATLAQEVDVAGIDLDVALDPTVDEQLTDLPITGYDEQSALAGNLVGEWVDVLGAGPMVALQGRFDVTKTDPRFEGLMAYHHIDAIQRYFQEELGLTSINAEPQTVLALPLMGYDNSFYQPGNDLIAFGAGGVDDGEDAEVIIHELGHAIHDDQVPGWGTTHQGGAMGEGFGDFLAATYFARSLPDDATEDGFNACVAEWDATSYSSSDPPCLRRTDTGKTYPADFGGSSVHADGEIWSNFMWAVRAQLGDTPAERSDNVLRLLLTAHELLEPDAQYADAVTALVTVVDSDAFGLDEEAMEEWHVILTAEAATSFGMVIPPLAG